MPTHNPEISGGSIVLLGSFNPKIFQPEWFGRQNLIPQEEVEQAEIKFINPQYCQFETERFALQVTSERFLAASKGNTDAILLRDLVLGTFFVLEHTPSTAIGLNRHMHFQMASEEAWHRVGDKLAPKDGWSGVIEDGRPGMQSLDILTPKSEPPGAMMLVRVQPSLKIKPGVYFETNEHYPAGSLNELLVILRERWEEAQNYARRIAEHILDWAADE